MKWLTVFLCLLAFTVTAQEPIQFEDTPTIPQVQEPESKIIPLPFMLQCTPVAADEMLEQLYGELGFLEGDAQIFKPDMTTATGKMRMFVDPEKPRSWTIMIEFGPELHCMIMSGENIGPMVKGTEL